MLFFVPTPSEDVPFPEVEPLLEPELELELDVEPEPAELPLSEPVLSVLLLPTLLFVLLLSVCAVVWEAVALSSVAAVAKLKLKHKTNESKVLSVLFKVLIVFLPKFRCIHINKL